MNAAGDLVVEERFAIVPEWLIDAEISDAAFRLYSALLRYGQSSGARMPSIRRPLPRCGQPFLIARFRRTVTATCI